MRITSLISILCLLLLSTGDCLAQRKGSTRPGRTVPSPTSEPTQTSAELPKTESGVHHLRLTAVQIGASDFSLSSFGNPLDISMKILENGKEVPRTDKPATNGIPVPVTLMGRRGERLLDQPVEWTITFDPNKNYQIVLAEMSVVAATKIWSLPPTPKLGEWPFGYNGGQLLFGNESYLKFEDEFEAGTEPTSILGYDFTIIGLNDGTKRLTVAKSGKVLWKADEAVEIEVIRPETMKLGSDITGEGTPDVIINTYSGGAHCCFTDYVLQLGPTLVVIDTIEMGGSFEDIDGDGIAEVRTSDYTFDYWKMSHAESPIPEIVLKLKGGKYRLDKAMTQKPGPSESDLEKLAAEIRKMEGWVDYTSRDDMVCPGLQKLIVEMVNMVYTGHGGQTKILAESAWPAGIQGYEAFKSDFGVQLQKSQYIEDMR